MARLTGRVVFPGDPGWSYASEVYNARFQVQPKAVVFCQHLDDVASAVLWARQEGLPFRARSGGHSYEGYSLVSGGLVIDLSEMGEASVDRGALTARVGAGNTTLELSERLYEAGVTFPLATGPTVGIAGLTLGGGFGLTSRKFGLVCDNLLDVELVDAQGRVVHASPDENPDLFWALRGGGGGNYGIATAFTFRVHPVGMVGVFNLQWTWDAFQKIVSLWQEWAYDAEDGLASALQLSTAGTVKLYGQYTADSGDLPRLPALLQPLIQAVPPISTAIATVPFNIAAGMFFAEGTESVNPENPTWSVLVHSDHQIYKSTSSAAMEFFSPDAIATLKKGLEAVPSLSAPPSQPSMVQLLPGGGAPGRVAPDATAFYYRKAKFIVQYDGFWTAPQDADKTISWVEGLRTSLLPHTQGAYVNYVDSLIPDYLDAYYGKNINRLVAVKAQVDPQNVFNFPQSIPTSLHP